jgi:dimethylamine/trimethylamine dehydrogenase
VAVCDDRDLDIPGYDRDFVYRPEDILLGAKLPSGKVVILDNEGMHAGVGIAELLASRGADVELLTPSFSPLSPRVWGAQEGRPIVERLRAAGVRISATSYLKEIGDRQVIVEDVYSDAERVIANVAAVVLTTGREPVNDLETELDGKVPQLFTIGDALAPRMWAAASFEGHKFARYIGEPDAPQSVFDVYFGDDDPTLAPIPGDMSRFPPPVPREEVGADPPLFLDGFYLADSACNSRSISPRNSVW